MNNQEKPPNLLKKLELLNPPHTQHCNGKSPTRVPFSTTQLPTNRDKGFEELRNQIKLFKQNQRQHDTQNKANNYKRT